MKALVIGAGMMGKAITYDLAHSPGVGEIILADIDSDRVTQAAHTLGKNVKPQKLDVSFYDDVIELMSQVDVAIGATSYNHNLLLTKAAIEGGIHFCDLGGNMDVVDRQLSLH
ncbi:MAG TPA: saccharopine dehydrogenase NADP-binding domain-containing protein, partial [Bacteroidota bacterium]|nr:saccharopine dehydrogenase NADP-binding domain-containing protein [Bacteroidota bacterium]